MLCVEYDVKSAVVTDQGLSIMEPPLSFDSVIKAQGSTSPYMLSPSGNVLMLRPVQLNPDWGMSGTTTFQAGDYGSPAGWSQQAVRSSSDYWMHTVQGVSPLSLMYTFPANTGWYVEFRAYAEPKGQVGAIFDIQFGQFFWLIVFSDGRADLFDTRVGLLKPIHSGNIASGRHFMNQDVQLVILPFRRQHLLIWSPNLGGYMDVPVVDDSRNNITEACSPVLYSYAAPPAAMVSLTPLMYPADGVPSMNAPAVQLARPLSQAPVFTNSVVDQPWDSSLALVAVTPYVSSPPVRSFIYSVQMAGNTAHQSVEAQGVVGIGPSTSTTSGDSVCTGGGYAYSLYTPFLYLTVFGYPRLLGTLAYTGDVLSGVLKARLDLSNVRSQKLFEFTVDNPGGVYDSLKDLQNRRVRTSFTNGALLAGGTDADILADPDPDTPLIVANAYQPVYFFDGFTDQPGFVDGVASNVPVRCQGFRKQLRGYVFTEQILYDGMDVNAVITDVLERAGFVGPGDVGVVGMGLEIICESVSPPIYLASAVPGDRPLFSPPVGTTAEEFIITLENCTGWILDDLIAPGAVNSAWYWCSRSYFAASVYAAQGAPSVSVSSTFNRSFADAYGVGIPDAVLANQGLGCLAMLSVPPPKQSLEELEANYIMVVGRDDLGNALLSVGEDVLSVTDHSAENYIGVRKVYVFRSNAVNTQALANAVCASLYQNKRNAKTRLSFSLPDFYPQLAIGAPLTIVDYWGGADANAVVDSVVADLSGYGWHKTDVTVLRVV